MAPIASLRRKSPTKKSHFSKLKINFLMSAESGVDPDQLGFVVRWLEKTLETVPEFEITRENVEHLFAVAQRNVMLSRLAVEERNDARIRAEEYAFEARRIKGILEDIGITPQTLSMAGRTTLHSLAHAAVALRTPDCHFYEAILAMQEHGESLMKERATLEQERADLLARQDQAEAKRAATQEKISILEAEIGAKLAGAEKKRQQLDYFEKKRAEYNGLLEQCETHLVAVDYDPLVRHVECERLFKSLTGIENECALFEEKLTKFGDLEPTLQAAQDKLEGSRTQLAMLKAQYSESLSKIASKMGE